MAPHLTADPTTDQRLAELLDADVAFDARTRRGLSNHLPMELVALRRMGATVERMEDAFDGFAHHAVPRRDPGALAALRDQVVEHGIDTTVRVQLATLADSPTSEWFHSMIRLAYALDVAHPGQVAGSLASWAERRQPLPGRPPRPGDRSVAQAFAAVAGVAPADGAGRDLVALAGLPGFAHALDGVAVAGDLGSAAALLDDVAATVLAAHVAQNDFGTLHMVTGTQAARVVSARLDHDEAGRFAGRVAQAMAAAHLAVGAPTLPTPAALDRLRDHPTPGWEDIAVAAVATPDVHVTKLAYSCTVEHTRTGDPLYRWVAARAAGLA